jgi:hypothetical protein
MENRTSEKLSCAKGRYSKFSSYVACQIADLFLVEIL